MSSKRMLVLLLLPIWISSTQACPKRPCTPLGQHCLYPKSCCPEWGMDSVCYCSYRGRCSAKQKCVKGKPYLPQCPNGSPGLPWPEPCAEASRSLYRVKRQAMANTGLVRDLTTNGWAPTARNELEREKGSGVESPSVSTLEEGVIPKKLLITTSSSYLKHTKNSPDRQVRLSSAGEGQFSPAKPQI